MNKKAHSYHPADDSLEAKVNALRASLLDKQTAEASLKSKDDDRLGIKDEIEYALAVSTNSLALAINDLSAAELKQANTQGLLSKDELLEIEASKRSLDMATQREQNAQQSDHSLKR